MSDLCIVLSPFANACFTAEINVNMEMFIANQDQNKNQNRVLLSKDFTIYKRPLWNLLGRFLISTHI